MSEFVSILKYAITLEQEAIDFYDHLSGKTSRPEIQTVIGEIADQERAHKKKLENLLQKNEAPTKTKVYPDLKLADYVIAVDENKTDLNFEDSLVIGMKREKFAADLYARLSREVSDLETKQLFKFLADEERNHSHFFETKYDNLQE